jgi:putative aminopeptidase FrvX
VTAHIDTLGAMVSQIKPNGRLKLAALNGLEWNSVETEGLWIQTRAGNQIRGSLVHENGALHVNKEVATSPRNASTLEVRIDERTNNIEQTKMLGIEVGDFVSFDPRLEFSASGFVRSRFLDDKACVACLLAAVKSLRDVGVSCAQNTSFLISNYEEVGHGGTEALRSELKEMLVLDMACIGTGLQGDEYHCSICMKDSGGPYSRQFSNRLRDIAEGQGIDLVPDIYPFYGSDGTAYWRAGGGAEVALFGPGVDTSHGYERTHMDALISTATLVAEYLITN